MVLAISIFLPILIISHQSNSHGIQSALEMKFITTEKKNSSYLRAIEREQNKPSTGVAKTFVTHIFRKIRLALVKQTRLYVWRRCRLDGWRNWLDHRVRWLKNGLSVHKWVMKVEQREFENKVLGGGMKKYKVDGVSWKILISMLLNSVLHKYFYFPILQANTSCHPQNIPLILLYQPRLFVPFSP